MNGLFFTRRTVWWPTWTGWLCIVLLPAAFLVGWCFWGETFLSQTHREAADILVVEGWIGRECLPSVLEEFNRFGYRLLVVTGGLTGHVWSKNRESTTEYMHRELAKANFPETKLLLAASEEVENQRTYAAAVAVMRKLNAENLRPAAINVVSRGVHSRRTYSVFKKVFRGSATVGIITWDPYAGTGPWWHSSTRAKELLDESVSYALEAIASSGRFDRTLKLHLALAAAAAVVSGWIMFCRRSPKATR